MIIHPSSKLHLLKEDMIKKDLENSLESNDKDEIEFENFDVDIKDLEIKKSRCSRFIPKWDSMFVEKTILLLLVFCDTS
jgi:hypothetical protein